MILMLLVLSFCNVRCDSDDDIGYGLNIGNAIDVFANYGDLSQVTQVVSADYDLEDEPIIPFSEKNIRVFTNVSSRIVMGDSINNIDVSLCESFEDLLNTYFQNFQIQGTTKPWKAFLGDWIYDEIMRTFGIEYDTKSDNCCYVLVKLTKKNRTVELENLEGMKVRAYIQRAIDKLDFNDPAEIRRFMRSYGTHYIESFVTGNFIYQVFKYKRSGYNRLRSYIRLRNSNPSLPDNLRFYFSSYYLKHVGDIKVASGNKTVEFWARRNLRDSQYLYSRPSLLRLYYNNNLLYKLNDMLDHGALIGLKLKTLRPMFEDSTMAEKFAEIVENDLQLWEINA